MKKVFFSAIAFIAFATASMANTNVEKKDSVKEEIKVAGERVSCTRSASDNYGNQVTVTASVPSTGDYEIDKGNACAKAASAAKKSLADITAP